MKLTNNNRIIVNFGDDIDPIRAMYVVKEVMMLGKISESGGIPHYCWVTSFYDCVVYTNRKKKGQVADSFEIRKKLPGETI